MTALTEEAFVRAVEIDGHRRLCRHEAGHATAALLLGLDVRSVRAGFYPLADLQQSDPDEPAGEAVMLTSREHARELAIATLCGPMAEPRPDWPPAMVVATYAP